MQSSWRCSAPNASSRRTRRSSPPPDLTVVLQRLALVITSLTTHAFDQDSNNRSAKGETEKQRQLRLKLRNEQMSPIAAIAKHYFSTVPEFKELQMPPRSARGGAFIADASAMSHAASTYKTEPLARGLPADFLEQFQASLTTCEGSVLNREQTRSQRKGATKGLGLEVKEGRNVLKVLDASVRRALSENGALLGTTLPLCASLGSTPPGRGRHRLTLQ
jgi:hypothetical protein